MGNTVVKQVKSRSSSTRSSRSSAASCPTSATLQHTTRSNSWQHQSVRRSPSWGGYADSDSDKPRENYASFGDDDEIERAGAAVSPETAHPEPEVRDAGPLSVSTKIEYTSLARSQSQDVFGLVTVQAAEAAPKPQAKERQPLDIICVLDVSGSMTGNKIQLVQDAVRFVIRESGAQDRLSIVAFNHQARRTVRLRRMNANGKDEAQNSVLRLAAGGGTSIASGVEMAVEIAERRRQRNPVTAIMLLTDGQDGSSRNRLPALVSRAQRAGCALYAFGFGADHDAALLSNLAEQAQTPFTFVEDVENISAAFAGAIGGLSSVVAQSVKVVIDCSVQLKALHTPFPTERTGNRAVVQIPDLLAGERRDVLLELSVPQVREEETKLLEASASYWDLAAEAVGQTHVVSMTASRPADEPQPEIEPDAEVTSQRHRVEVAQTLEEAAAHGDAGQFDAAQQVLEAQGRKMKASKCMTPISENLVLELQDAQNRMQSRSSWEHGGMAEVKDAMNMHYRQRTTNCSISKASTRCASSKAMYLNSVQTSWIKRSG